MDLNAVLFYVLAVLTGVSAVAVVVTQNIVRAATWLLFALAGVAGLFFLLRADFVGATQLLIYVGGTLVLVVFGVMLTAQGPFVSLRIGAAEWAIAAAAGIVVYGALAVTLVEMQPPTVRAREREAATGEAHAGESHPLTESKHLGSALLGDERVTPFAFLTGTPEKAARQRRTRTSYLLPFEIVSVHLLVVLIGAAYLARAKRRRGGAS